MKRNLVGKILGKIKIFVQDFVPIRTALRVFPFLPGLHLTICFHDASSALVQLINQWLNSFTYVFALSTTEEKTQILVTRIELVTSAVAGMQIVEKPLSFPGRARDGLDGVGDVSFRCR